MHDDTVEQIAERIQPATNEVYLTRGDANTSAGGHQAAIELAAAARCRLIDHGTHECASDTTLVARTGTFHISRALFMERPDLVRRVLGEARFAPGLCKSLDAHQVVDECVLNQCK